MHINQNRRTVNMSSNARNIGFLVMMLLLAHVLLVAADVTVTGTVRAPSGRPISNAYVEAIPVITEKTTGTVGNFGNPWVAAEHSGFFRLRLPPGRYRIRAKDEVDGYPDPSFWLGLDPSAKFPHITVGDKDISGVEVVLGAQGGILTGKIRDAHTQNPIAGAQIRIQDAGNNDAYVELASGGSGTFRYTVPSKSIIIAATARGYRAQELPEQTLSPGEHRDIQLELERE
jgi:hypothetical protein